MTFGERVRDCRKQKGITLEEIEEATGLSNSNLSKIERNRTSPSLDAAVLISDFLNEPLDYLAKGIVKYNEPDPDIKDLINSYKLLNKDNQHALKTYMSFLISTVQEKMNYKYNPADQGLLLASEKGVEYRAEESKVYLPVLGTVAAGMPIMADELLEGFLPVPAKRVRRNTYIVRAKGESMIDAGIRNGDLIIINPQPTVEQGEMALVKVNGDVTVKKFYRYDHEIRLKPANEKMKDIVITDLAKAQVLGKVIGVIPAAEANIAMRDEFNGEEDQ